MPRLTIVADHFKRTFNVLYLLKLVLLYKFVIYKIAERTDGYRVLPWVYYWVSLAYRNAHACT